MRKGRFWLVSLRGLYAGEENALSAGMQVLHQTLQLRRRLPLARWPASSTSDEKEVHLPDELAGLSKQWLSM